jgi:hypothetical protein
LLADVVGDEMHCVGSTGFFLKRDKRGSKKSGKAMNPKMRESAQGSIEAVCSSEESAKDIISKLSFFSFCTFSKVISREVSATKLDYHNTLKRTDRDPAVGTLIVSSGPSNSLKRSG